jgi:hypothetical protein
MLAAPHSPEAQKACVSEAYSRPTAASRCEPSVRRGARPGSHPSHPRSPKFSGFQGLACEPECDRRDGRVRPLQGSEAQDFCSFQALSAANKCELRTRIRALPLAKYRAAPPVPVSAQEGPVSQWVSRAKRRVENVSKSLSPERHHVPNNRQALRSKTARWTGCRTHILQVWPNL